jgi:hypothetical protein
LLLVAPAALAERIAWVVDGGSAVTVSSEKTRLMHLDAPEAHGECLRSETRRGGQRLCCGV